MTILEEVNFNTSQEALYDAANLTYALCLKNLERFRAYRSIYTADYLADKLKAVEAAQAMPDLPNRMERRKMLRAEATVLLQDGLQNFRELEGYILHTWDKGPVRDAKLASAGQPYFKKAMRKSWDATGKLLKSGNDFIAANLRELSAGNNMPATFQEKFNKNFVDFTEKFKKYVAQDSVKVEESDDKQKANNAVYAAVQATCRDASCIFAKERVIKDQFVFRRLVIAAGHVGVAGATGLITQGEGDAARPVSDVEVTVLNSKIVGQTNAKGRYNLRQLSSGRQTLLFTKPGYQQLQLVVTIKKGVTSRFNVVMVPTAASANTSAPASMIVAA